MSRYAAPALRSERRTRLAAANTRRFCALNGAARIRSVIDQSISVIDRSIRDGKAAPDTVLGRLIALKGKDPTLTNGQIRAIMVGLLTGFIPTNTLGAGKILQAFPE